MKYYKEENSLWKFDNGKWTSYNEYNGWHTPFWSANETGYPLPHWEEISEEDAFAWVMEHPHKSSRKLRANWSIDLEQDIKVMHGIDVIGEIASMQSHEIQKEIDKQLLAGQK